MYQINDEMLLKFYKLEMLFKDFKKVIVAYSGGVDSTFLMSVGTNILEKNCLGVFIKSEVTPQREFNEALSIAEKYAFNIKIVEMSQLTNENFAMNSKNRCYFCKIDLFKKIKEIAKENEIEFIVEGSNFDDINDYRPGMKALEELNIISPLRELKFTKNEIRALSKMLDLPTWNKDSLACLSSRISYDEKITENKLKAIDKIEEYLVNNNFRKVRARHINNTLKIEVDKEDIEKIVKEPFRGEIIKLAKELGYMQITLDLEGYKQGKMNIV